MKIVLEADSLLELRDIVEQMVILLPEKIKKEPKTKSKESKPEAKKKQTKHKEEAKPKAELKKRGRPATVNRDRILRLVEKGMSATYIATQTGYGYSTVHRVIQEARKNA